MKKKFSQLLNEHLNAKMNHYSVYDVYIRDQWNERERMEGFANGKTSELKFDVRAHLFRPDVVASRKDDTRVPETMRTIGIPAHSRDWTPTSTVKNDLR